MILRICMYTSLHIKSTPQYVYKTLSIQKKNEKKELNIPAFDYEYPLWRGFQFRIIYKSLLLKKSCFYESYTIKRKSVK